MQTISVIIVNWNGKNDTVKCLDTLKKIDKKGYQVNIIVVDNGSTNDSVITIRNAHPWVTIVETHKNLGFTGGTNAGIKEAINFKSDIIWLLNNDTLVERNVLNVCKDFNDPQIGIIGHKIYFAPGHEYHKDRYKKSEIGKVFWYAGGLIDWKNMYASHKGVDEFDHEQYDLVEDTPFITGCSMFIRTEVVNKIGMFDEHFYLYLEDLDYCLRAKNAGFRLIYNPQGIIWHVNAGSSGGPGNPLHEYYLTRNRLLIGFRYAPVRTRLALIRESFKFALGTSKIRRKAVFDAFFNKWGNQYEPRLFKS